ncbi:Glyceraldehyde-3-phosphate dehydrogenase [Phytophthora cinnamomi]|uniref:Glyceraldehyde-3-phosphate dehydrogenase n=1 Tax=Phytophthora cinnamomi TaxID=4785 RepID=UPI00355938D4|nr:Glyceraldehyde-3-phosphate dehydrogenase [Phytophthora cinnamomi]
MTWFFIKEEKTEAANFREYINSFWDLLCSRAVYQVIAYTFFSGIFASITYTASSPVQSYMVGVTPINSTLSDILSNLLFAAGAVVMVVDCACSLITVWDVFRSQWFWLVPPIAVELPYGIGWIISTFVVVELAGMGNEGAMYGLITTVGNISSPFASTLTLLIDGPFNITNTRVQADDHSIRADITYTIIIMYAMTIFSWLFLFLLPNQKAATQELIRKGGHSKILGGITVAYLLFALVWSVTTNVLAIFDSTSCLVIAGGTGC